jgi:hypothetical protein
MVDSIKFLQLTEILRIHGKTIKRMTFEAQRFPSIQKISAYRIVNFFKQVPNLTSLELRGSPWIFEKLRYFEPILTKLEFLNFDCPLHSIIRGQTLAEIIKPHTFKNLLINQKMKNLEVLIQNQSSIKSLTIGGSALQKFNCFASLQLEQLCIENADVDDHYIHQLIVQHPELKSIEASFYFSPQTFNVICSMQNLETLSLDVHDDVLEEINQLANLPKIKEIKFYLNGDLEEEEAFLEISLIPLHALENVTMSDTRYRFFNNPIILENIALNWSNLKNLTVDNAAVDGIDFLNEFLDKLPKLESLSIEECHTMDVPRKYFFHNNNQQYPQLKKLCLIGNVDSFSSLNDLLECTPNLEVLEIARANTLYCPKILRSFLSLKNLKELEIKFYFGSILINVTRQEMQLILDLCRRLQKFEIIFPATQFSEEFIAMLEPYSTVDVNSLTLRKK